MSDPTTLNSAEDATVLIVEDSPTQAEQLRCLLEDSGFTVLAARDGQEALEIARAKRPSVIVSDVMMPKMDGNELCLAVKSDPAIKSIGVILVTALSSPHDVFKGLEAGADNFLVKPYQEEQLISRIRYLLATETERNARQHETGIEIQLAGKRHLITSGRQQILDLLISTYEQAVGLNEQLEIRQRELAQSNKTLNALYDLAGGFNHCRTEEEVAGFAVKGALSIPSVRAAWLYLRDDDGYRLAGLAGNVELKDTDASSGNCACQRMLDGGELTGTEHIQQCECLKAASPGNPCGHVGIPLMVDGVGVGLLNLISDNPDGSFSADQRRMLASIGIQIGDALQRARFQEVLEEKVAERTRQLEAEIGTRRQAEDAADAAKERLLDAIQSINDGFALYDAADTLLVCNSGYRDMHFAIKDLVVPGVKFEDLVRAGLDCGDGPAVSPSEMQVDARVAQHRQADGTPTILNRGGRWLMLTERRTREGGIVAIETDIAELKKADIAKDEFLAKVSHELRTPLTPIHGALAIIKSGKVADQPEKLDDLVDMAIRNSARLMSIVNDLLDFTRISSGRFSLESGVIDLQSLLEQVVENKRIGPNPPTITLTVTPPAKGIKLEADSNRIQQVLDNLLSNAIKFTDSGGHIEVDVEKRKKALRVSVVDHGPGIPKEFQDRAFEAFSQADSSSTRRQGGVGLGLSICKSIMEAHGGTIGFASKEGEGTTFYFELPLGHRHRASGKGQQCNEGARARHGKPASSGRRAALGA
jgi:signal transduction histidine kinase/DNA-binding response OmpR family regulator